VTVLSADTDPRAEEVMLDILRRMTPVQRLRRSLALRHSVLSLARVRILRDHPEASPREVSLRLASLWLDADTMRRVWGWDPDVEGF
jgi:hypothetical protein